MNGSARASARARKLAAGSWHKEREDASLNGDPSSDFGNLNTTFAESESLASPSIAPGFLTVEVSKYCRSAQLPNLHRINLKVAQRLKDDAVYPNLECVNSVKFGERILHRADEIRLFFAAPIVANRVVHINFYR